MPEFSSVSKQLSTCSGTDRGRQTQIRIIPLWLTGIVRLGPPRRHVEDKSVHRASDSSPTPIQNMRVDHRGAHVGVPEQLLNRADVVAVFQKMRAEGMAQGVRAGWLRDASPEPRVLDGLLENRFVEVMPMPLSCYAVGVMAGCREHPLPSPLFAGMGILALQRVGQADPAEASLEVIGVLAFDGLEVPKEGFSRMAWRTWSSSLGFDAPGEEESVISENRGWRCWRAPGARAAPRAFRRRCGQRPAPPGACP